MPDNVIDTINKQAGEEINGIEFADINLKTTAIDYEERGYDSDSDFEDDDKLYKTSDDSTVNDDNDLGNEPEQLEEDQQQHFNVQEVNDSPSTLGILDVLGYGNHIQTLVDV